jgi:hypothetical protein
MGFRGYRSTDRTPRLLLTSSESGRHGRRHLLRTVQPYRVWRDVHGSPLTCASEAGCLSYPSHPTQPRLTHPPHAMPPPRPSRGMRGPRGPLDAVQAPSGDRPEAWRGEC